MHTQPTVDNSLCRFGAVQVCASGNKLIRADGDIIVLKT